MVKVELYQFVYSASSEKARRFLQHKKVPYTTVEVDWFDRSALQKASKQGLVPALQCGDKVIAPDTSQIMDYVEDNFDGPTLFPDDSRGLCHLINQYVESTLFPLGLAAFLPTASAVMKSEAFDKDVVRLSGGKSAATLRAELPQLATRYLEQFKHMDVHLARRKFFVGEKMSAADHAVYSNYWFATNNPDFKALVDAMPIPSVHAWAARMKDFFFTKLPF